MRYVYAVRIFAATPLLAGCVLLPASAAAQDAAVPQPSRFVAALSESAKDADPAEQAGQLRVATPSLRDASNRPSALLPLYGSLGVLQGLDIHSTSRGLSSGRAREANPVMEPIVGNRVMFIAVKAATTAGVVWASERLWRRQNRKAAVVLTAITNIGLAAVVAHNYRVSR